MSGRRVSTGTDGGDVSGTAAVSSGAGAAECYAVLLLPAVEMEGDAAPGLSQREASVNI